MAFKVRDHTGRCLVSEDCQSASMNPPKFSFPVIKKGCREVLRETCLKKEL